MEIVSPKYADLIDHYDDALESPDQEKAAWWLKETHELLEECKQVNDKMQNEKTLRIRVAASDKKASAGKKNQRWGNHRQGRMSVLTFWESNVPSITLKQKSSWRPWNLEAPWKFFWTMGSRLRMFPEVSRMTGINCFPLKRKMATSK